MGSTKIKGDLETKIVLVTGGCQGIGIAIVEEFLSLGSRVVVVDILDEKKGVSLINDLGYPQDFWAYHQADVSSLSQAEEVVEKIQKKFGSLHILINNAGINCDAVIWKMEEADWDQVIEVNLKGSFNYAKAVASLFREQKYGKIVNISSINGLRGKFGQTNYAASKAGLVGLTKSLARELGSSQVNVNAVAPGIIKTAMTKKLPEKFIQQALEESALKRIGKPKHVATTVSFLCSESAQHITGEIIKVDGGQYL